MNAVASSTATSAIAFTPAQGPCGAAGGTSLLPSPASDAMPADAMSMVYQLMQKQREANLDMGKTQVESRKADKEIQMAAQRQALADEAEAKESAAKWGILGKVASVIAIAVSAVASVFSCGAASGLLVAATVLSTMAFVEGETNALGKMTGNAENSKWFTLGLGVASAICSGGAGIAASTTTLATKVVEVSGEAATVTSEVVGTADSSKEAGYVSMGLGAAGAIAGGGAGIAGAARGASRGVSRAAIVVKEVAAGVELGNSVLAATGTIGTSQCSADAVDAQANAKIAKQQMAKLDRLIQWVIDGVKETDGSHKRAMETLQGAVQTQGQALAIASSMRA